LGNPARASRPARYREEKRKGVGKEGRGGQINIGGLNTRTCTDKRQQGKANGAVCCRRMITGVDHKRKREEDARQREVRINIY
jgi:hypothetical protein